MEKRRRARINHSLSVLKSLIIKDDVGFFKKKKLFGLTFYSTFSSCFIIWFWFCCRCSTGQQFESHFTIPTWEGRYFRIDSFTFAYVGKRKRGTFTTAKRAVRTRRKGRQQDRQWRQIVSTRLSSLLPWHWSFFGRTGLRVNQTTLDGTSPREKAKNLSA